MRRISVFVAATLGSLALALGDGPPFSFCDQKCKQALGYLAGSCRSPVPPFCIDDVHSQATEFCSSYLTLTATSLATTTGIVTVTVTETDTVESTLVETSTTTTDTTTTDVATSTATSLSTTVVTVATSYSLPPLVTVTVKRRGPAPSCPDLGTRTPWLTRRPASMLSSICSRLGVTPTTTVTDTSTATSTATSSDTTTTTSLTTSTTVEVSLSITTFTSTTVTTTSALATSTVTIDYCDPAHAVQLDTETISDDLTMLTPVGPSDAYACCRICWTMLDCAANAFNAVGQCQLLLRSNPSGGLGTPQCPLGVDDELVYIEEEGGNTWRGPCGPLY
ncbi:hypothetical protein B0T16DRAFT_450594 [Cercophora newfieldiana]|uniref:Apple domain-containing protein n=1 Tax=Cercophora newfieldiana TaxID=92897 RepID=A0AA39YNF8_9PEZI|nr:hypothetical protein B0T16DRAFT_450594 [Cercophora newfieldiana]